MGSEGAEGLERDVEVRGRRGRPPILMYQHCTIHTCTTMQTYTARQAYTTMQAHTTSLYMLSYQHMLLHHMVLSPYSNNISSSKPSPSANIWHNSNMRVTKEFPLS